MGGFDPISLDIGEPLVRYHSCYFDILTITRYPGIGHSLVGSLTGAVASQKVTEALKGSLRTVGNRL